MQMVPTTRGIVTGHVRACRHFFLQYESTSSLSAAVTTSDGYVVVAGRTSPLGSYDGYDFLAMKLDPMDGELLWTYQASVLALVSLAVEASDMMPRIGIMSVVASLPLGFWCPSPLPPYVVIIASEYTQFAYQTISALSTGIYGSSSVLDAHHEVRPVSPLVSHWWLFCPCRTCHPFVHVWCMTL